MSRNTGPQRRPSASWSPGAVHALSVGFYPEALDRLICQPMEAYLDQHLPLETVAQPPLLQACQAVLDACDDDPFATLETYFQSLWREPSRASLAPYLGDWVRSLTTRAAHSTAARSLRQLQRRIRDWTGLVRATATCNFSSALRRHSFTASGRTTAMRRTSPPLPPMRATPTNRTWGVKSVGSPACRRLALGSA